VDLVTLRFELQGRMMGWLMAAALKSGISYQDLVRDHPEFLPWLMGTTGKIMPIKVFIKIARYFQLPYDEIAEWLLTLQMEMIKKKASN